MTLKQIHKWEPTGVTGYPITHPIVGQTDFYQKFKHWLPLVGEDRFAHVFAVVAPWGVGKSRLGYEIVAQVNGRSKGWKVRGEHGALVDAQLFDGDEDREQYLALYIRYSQVAHRQLNLDNWFAPAVYKALAPLARGDLDASIQHQVAKQARDRLEAAGFDPTKLAAAMELGQHEEAIYADTALATRLCNAAFAVLEPFGIRHVVIVLDELETAAERATGGMEAEEARAMDGKSITMLRKAVELLGREDIEMMSKAVKEEDARARFPWLRFVALCSPAIGDELKEVQSTDRRFEIVDLSRNAFSDVSAFVKTLEAEGRLLRSYPLGLVEAAYMMSGANFGWFNVIMAVVDQALLRTPPGEVPSLAWVFQRAIQIQDRIGRYVLDQRALDEIEMSGPVRDAVAELLFGQQPLPIDHLGASTDTALSARNIHGEPVATRYHRVTWRRQACMQALTKNRFQRQSGSSKYTAPGIPDAIDLERLLDDLATLAVHEESAGVADDERPILLPGTLPDFLQLLDLVHPHPASEETGRTLWMELVGTTSLAETDATHLGPSVEMLRRLDIRLRKASVGSVLRSPEENDAFSKVQESQRPTHAERALQVLTGALRLLDQNWSYDPEPAGLGDGVVAVKTPKTGLIDFKGFSLHPKGKAVFAWVASDAALLQLAEAVAADHHKQGRYPVLAFTTDFGLPERFEKQKVSQYKKARESIVLVHLNSGEEAALQSIGLRTSAWDGYRLRWEGFTTRFAERLNRIRTPIAKRVREWRHEVTSSGTLAWPIRPNGTLKHESLEALVKGWRVLMLEQGGKTLGAVGAAAGLDHGALLAELEKLGLSPAAAPKGYGTEDGAGLFAGHGASTRPMVPQFLIRSIVVRLRSDLPPLDLDVAKRDWLWGFTWDGSRASDIFREWMFIAVELGWAERVDTDGGKGSQYKLVPREALRAELTAASKWLDDDYPRLVQRLSERFGDAMIKTWFDPTTGSKSMAARKRLVEAAALLDQLDALDNSAPVTGEEDTAVDWFVQATRLRLQARALVRRVFLKKNYAELPANLDERTLNLTDDERPLWERMRQAEHFADAVERLAVRTRKRIPLLGDEMREVVGGIPSFPINLFTRPLSKIDHIVHPGLTGKDPECTTQRAQNAKPDTLLYYLKELRVADAMESIRALAREIGVGERPSEDRSLQDADGDILTAFRDIQDRYGRARAAIADLAGRVQALVDAMDGAPPDFVPPASVSLADVRDRPELIEGELDQSLDDDVEDLLHRHDDEMNLGRFGPLMKEARTRLLDAPERSIKGLEGKVRTLENAVTAYRKVLLDDHALLANRAGLNALRRARGQVEVPLPALDELTGRSLADARIYVDGVSTGWSREGTVLLGDTGVSFPSWLDVIARVRDQQDPGVPAAQMEALVAAGFLRRVYALGGAQ